MTATVFSFPSPITRASFCPGYLPEARPDSPGTRSPSRRVSGIFRDRCGRGPCRNPCRKCPGSAQPGTCPDRFFPLPPTLNLYFSGSTTIFLPRDPFNPCTAVTGIKNIYTMPGRSLPVCCIRQPRVAERISIKYHHGINNSLPHRKQRDPVCRHWGEQRVWISPQQKKSGNSSWHS
jgi:hypothetical protein